VRPMTDLVIAKPIMMTGASRPVPAARSAQVAGPRDAQAVAVPHHAASRCLSSVMVEACSCT
jgi:hypothetical protein